MDRTNTNVGQNHFYTVFVCKSPNFILATLYRICQWCAHRQALRRARSRYYRLDRVGQCTCWWCCIRPLKKQHQPNSFGLWFGTRDKARYRGKARLVTGAMEGHSINHHKEDMSCLHDASHSVCKTQSPVVRVLAAELLLLFVVGAY